VLGPDVFAASKKNDSFHAALKNLPDLSERVAAAKALLVAAFPRAAGTNGFGPP